MRKKSYICNVNVKYVLSVAQASVCNGLVSYLTVTSAKVHEFRVITKKFTRFSCIINLY